MGFGLALKAVNDGGAKLQAIVVHKSSMSCGIFGLCFSAWFMHLCLRLGMSWGCIWFWFWGLVGLGLVLFKGKLSIGGRGNSCTTLALTYLTTD